MHFWYDHWLSSGPLYVRRTDISHINIKIKDCWIDDSWNVELLKDLVGEEITKDITQKKIKGCIQLDRCVSKPTPNGHFSTTSAWEVV